MIAESPALVRYFDSTGAQQNCEDSPDHFTFPSIPQSHELRLEILPRDLLPVRGPLLDERQDFLGDRGFGIRDEFGPFLADEAQAPFTVVEDRGKPREVRRF